MTAQLVLVHGRAQEFQDAGQLKAAWLEAFSRGLAKSGLSLPIDESDVRFPYYGQTLNDLLVGMDGPPADVIVKGTAGVPEHQDLLRSVVDEVRAALGVGDEEVAAAMQAEVIEKGSPANWPWVQTGLRLIDRHVPGGGAVLALFTYDVHQYLGNIGIRDRIEKGVRKAIQPRVPTVVVGHSLGSVITYVLLGREGTALNWNVPLHLTVGSPLGIDAIRRRLVPIDHPACVVSWFNARDPRDVVALNPLDTDHFSVEPEIANKSDVNNHTSNRHGIAGYLDDVEVAKRIYDALTRF